MNYQYDEANFNPMRPDVIFINILYIHIIHHIAFWGPDIAPPKAKE